MPKVRFSFGRIQGSMAETVWEWCEGVPANAEIFIDDRLTWDKKLLVENLIHEVVHLARPHMQHSRAFVREMVRVWEATGWQMIW